MINIINNKTALLTTTFIVKLKRIISDLKEKSGMSDVYDFDDKDKLSKIDKDLENI